MGLWQQCKSRPRLRRLLLVLVFALVTMFPVATWAQLASSVVPAQAYQRVRDEGRVVVLVDLQDTTLPTDRREVCCAKYARTQQSVLDALPGSGCTVRYRYRYSPVLLVEITDATVLDLLDGGLGGVRNVLFDSPGRGAVAESSMMVGADRVFQNYGVKGEGRVVAVLDTGIDSDHPDFDSAILHQHHFLNQGSVEGPGAEDTSVCPEPPEGEEPPPCGHGVNVAGIVAARGAVAPRGIAPGADLIVIKVLNDNGRGWVADWAAGVEHAVKLHENGDFEIDVIHMSLGTDALHAGVCDAEYVAFSNACQEAQDLGISVIASAGNQRSTLGLEAPGCFSSVYSVGSVLDSLPDTLSSFSNRTAMTDFLAPGEFITSSGLAGGTSTWRGTSQAAPHVSAAFCLLREIEPTLTPAMMRDWIAETGVMVFDTRSRLEYPRLDILAAVEPLVADVDCDSSEKNDAIEIILGSVSDCNDNGIPDTCDIATNPFLDCDENMVIDFCEGVFVPCLPRFLRGDVNGDVTVDTTDGVVLLGFLFLGKPSFLFCDKASDIDDNAVLDLTDPILLLRFVILGGDPPPAPYPGCGFEPTADALICQSQCFEP